MRNLVFTSAGPHAAIDSWVRGDRKFDLWIAWYADGPGRYRDVADRYVERRGAKFPNLHALWTEDSRCLEPYDAVLVLDDDLLIDTDSINRLFELREAYDLSVLQPAYLPGCRISHPITRCNRRYRLRFTEFVEVGCPLFRRDHLETFLEEYDPRLIGWGVDHWFIHVLRRQPNFRAAVIDEVVCVNPHDADKGGRQIDRLQSAEARETMWEEIRRGRNIDEADTEAVLGGIRRPWLERIRARNPQISTERIRPTARGRLFRDR